MFEPAHDAEQQSLDAKRRELDEREAALARGTKQAAELKAPPTPEEAERLEARRVSSWTAKLLKRESLENIADVPSTELATALRLVPIAGWPDRRDDIEHLRDLRKQEGVFTPPPVPEPEPEPGEPGALSALLGNTTK